MNGRRHSDNLNNLVIASVSLGAERTFILSPRLPAKNGSTKITKELEKQLEGRKSSKFKSVFSCIVSIVLMVRLANGSLVVMQGVFIDYNVCDNDTRSNTRVLEGMLRLKSLLIPARDPERAVGQDRSNKFDFSTTRLGRNHQNLSSARTFCGSVGDPYNLAILTNPTKIITAVIVIKSRKTPTASCQSPYRHNRRPTYHVCDTRPHLPRHSFLSSIDRLA